MSACVCGSGLEYKDCCKPYHQGKAAPTAEVLMRSRYVAYVLRDGAYLHRTWSADTRPPKASLMALPRTHWLGLTVLRTQAGGEGDETGVVEFVARFAPAQGEPGEMHETSRFVREKGRWVYVDGVVDNSV